MAQLTLFTEDFNSSSSLPSGWTQVSVSGSDVWTINNGGYFDNGSNHPSTAHSGTRNAFLFSQSGTTRKLVSPSIDLSGMGNIQLKFYEARGKWGNDQDKLKVYYKTSASSIYWYQVAYYTSNTPNWTLRTVTLPNPSSTYYIAFEGIASYGFGVCIDDITVTGYIAFDAGVTDYEIKDHNYLYATIKNYGVDNLTSATIAWKIDTLTTKTYSWSGNLTQGSTANVLIDTANFSHGLHSFKLWTENPNNKGDGDHNNDTLETTYYLINNFPYQQGFETTNHYWLQATNDDFDWTRQNNGTPTFGTGPSSAYEGQYYFYASSLGNVNKQGVFKSPGINISQLTNPYLEFSYHMYADPQINQPMGTLLLEADTGFSMVDTLWYKSGNQGNQWQQALVGLSSVSNLNNLGFISLPASYWSDIAIDRVRIFDMPFVDLGSDTSICLGNSITLTAPTGNNFSYTWTIGGTPVSSASSITIDSTAQVICTVSGSFGYSVTDTVQLSIKPYPSISFSPVDTSVCALSNQVQFVNLSTISTGTISYVWQYGDSIFSSQSSPVYLFDTAGTYHIKLTGISDAGCSDSAFGTVRVFPNPVAAMSVQDTAQCLTGNLFNIQNQTTITNGSVKQYKWFAGDGTLATTVSFSHTYTVADTFLLKLVAESDSGCFDSALQSIIVFPQPIAGFSINDSLQCLRGNTAVFTNQTQLASGSFTSEWNFGDQDTSTLMSPMHIYKNSGDYSVWLKSMSDQGCRDSVIHMVYLFPNPVAKWEINDSTHCLKDNKVIFKHQSTITAGSIQSVNWEFGDGHSSVADSIQYSYSSPGTYLVKLIAVSDRQCRDTAMANMYIFAQPVAGFMVDSSQACLRNNFFQMKNQSTISAGTLTNFWFYDNGKKSQAENPVLSFDTSGVRVISLVATSSNNCSDSVSQKIRIYPNPAAGFQIKSISSCLDDNLFNFNNKSTIDSGTLNNYWDFGDGTLSQLDNPSHHYTKTGSYIVNLVVVSVHSCADTLTKTTHVSEPPIALFTINDTVQCLNSNVFKFTNSSTSPGENTLFNWHFGDGNTSDSFQPVYSYSASGKFSIKLKVISDSACSDSMQKDITILPNPLPDLGADTTLHLNDTIRLFAGSGYVSYKWSNATTDSILDVFGQMLNAGNNEISVEVTGNHNCKGADTIIIFFDTTNSVPFWPLNNIVIYPNPAREFIIVDPGQNTFTGRIIITGMNGKIVSTRAVHHVAGSLEIPVMNLEKGNYLLWLQFDDKIRVKQFVKL